MGVRFVINDVYVSPVKLSLVNESDSVGSVDVLQQIPLTVTDAPPSCVILPPLLAVVEVISVIDVVLTVGISSVVNNVLSPYPVPTAFVAYALT